MHADAGLAENSESFTSPVTTETVKEVASSEQHVVQKDDDEPVQPSAHEKATATGREVSSRLCLARNRARRHCTLKPTAYSPIVVEIDDNDGEYQPASTSNPLLESTPAKRKRSSRESTKKRGRPPSPSKPEKSKPLHPFFKATTSAVVSAKERQKRPRVPLELTDPWQHIGSTRHINFAKSHHPYAKPLSILQSASTHISTPAQTNVTFNYFPRRLATRRAQEDANSLDISDRPAVVQCQKIDNTAWSERYKRDQRLDVISGAQTSELVDWLREWYKTPSRDSVVCLDGPSDDSSDESEFSELKEGFTRPDEAIALILGDTGSGKTTVVENAAHQLGLSLLEINASVCRTGKLVRDVVKEALRTHRVTKANPFVSNSVRSKLGDEDCSASTFSAKTLIVFEEVDELHEDEKGFWSSIQELMSSNDCRRPVICTATSFTSQMRQVFIECKDPVIEDMERLFCHAKPTLPLSPLHYKFIKIPPRSERQSSAILKRVVSSESADLSEDLSDFLALACRKDSRKGINLLQFWCAFGLAPDQLSSGTCDVSPGKDSRTSRGVGAFSNLVGIDIIQSTMCDNLGMPTFHVGSDHYVEKIAKRGEDAASSGIDDGIHALDAWCESLEALSDVDSLQSVMNGEVVRRCTRDFDSFGGPCFDAELRLAEDICSAVETQALQSCRQYLSFKKYGRGLLDIAYETADMLEMTGSSECEQIHSKRHVLAEHLAYLRGMAMSDAKNAASRESSGKPLRRTRSRTRKGGFCALELDTTTVSFLKSSSLE